MMSHLVAIGKYYFDSHMKLKIQYRNPLYENYLVLNFEPPPIWRTSIFSSYITSMMPSSLYSIFHKFCPGYMTCALRKRPYAHVNATFENFWKAKRLYPAIYCVRRAILAKFILEPIFTQGFLSLSFIMVVRGYLKKPYDALSFDLTTLCLLCKGRRQHSK